jgi:lambda repressor-like predicted transcriptional regulator
MPKLGATPDKARRTAIAKLRAEGLTFTEIGKRLGITRQAANEMLHRSGERVQPPGIHCRECKHEICPWNSTWRGGIRKNPPVYCLGCLAKHPEATLGARIMAYRMHAGMSRRELSRMTGIEVNYLGRVERDTVSPLRTDLKKLELLLGTGIVNLEARGRMRTAK